MQLPSPPAGFQPVTACFHPRMELAPPPWLQGRPMPTSPSKREGLRYESKTCDELARRFPRTYVPGFWISFFDGGDTKRWAQPDALLVDIPHGTITVVEVKLRHTARSWWQVEHLYLPLVRELFGPEWNYLGLEVVHWFDPTTPFPTRPRLVEAPERATRGAFNVWIYKP